MKFFRIPIILLVTASLNVVGQTFTNASFETWGVAGCEINTAPDGWLNYSNLTLSAGQTDGADEINFSSCASTIPTSASDGNAYARMYARSTVEGEGIYQMVSGFTVNGQYKIVYNYAGSSFGGNLNVKCHLFIEDVDVNQTPSFSSFQSTWSTQTYNFTATATTLKIGFRMYGAGNAWGNGGLDNFKITPCALTPLNLNTSICAGNPLTLDVSTPNTSYLWQNGSVSPTFTASQPGIYWVKRTESCVRTDTILVGLFPSPSVELGSDMPLCDGSLNLNVASAGTSYLWQDNSSDPNFTVSDTGKYWVQVANQFGCKTADTIHVNNNCDIGLYVPNTFSPNMDLLNDHFSAQGNEVSSFEMKIFDRWGKLIFKSNDITAGWDGTNAGNKAPCEIYVWQITYQTANNEAKKQIGHVVLIR